MTAPTLRELSNVSVPEARSMLGFAVRELQRQINAEADRKRRRSLTDELARVERLRDQFEHTTVLRELYTGHTLREVGERIAAQMSELEARPSVDGCDQMVRSLHDASTGVARLRAGLVRGHR